MGEPHLLFYSVSDLIFKMFGVYDGLLTVGLTHDVREFRVNNLHVCEVTLLSVLVCRVPSVVRLQFRRVPFHKS